MKSASLLHTFGLTKVVMLVREVEDVKNQLELQSWYFWFMVFFVIGVTVVGGMALELRICSHST